MIEVGIDVANATVMVIEGAERYGVSQLHQLRGRVGRGEHDSVCLLFPERAGELARKRLRAIEGERDGFALAEVDLALRGEGEVLGTRQHGLPRFAAAELPEVLNERVRQSREARRQNIERLRQVRQRAHEDLMGSLAWVRELVSMIHLAKFTGAPAARAEELVAQIAAAVEGLSEVTWREELAAEQPPMPPPAHA